MIEPLKPVTLAGNPSNPPVLFLHGFMGSMDDWRAVAEALADRHHVLGINLPGHGPGWEGFPVQSLDIAACADAIVAHLDAMGLVRPAVAGYSMGGRIALCLAMRHPGQIGRLVLESASPGLDSEEKRAIRREQDSALAGRLSRFEPRSAAFRAFLEEWYALPLFTTLEHYPEMRAALVDRRHEQNTPRLLAQALRALGTGNQPDLWPELHAFTPPTLVLAGEKDRKYRIIAEDMALACPAMAAEIMTGCGHTIHLENLEGFVTVVRAFVNSPGIARV